LIPWPDVALGQMVKQYSQGPVTGVKRYVLQGTEALVKQLLAATQGGSVFQNADIERLNGTFRARLASLGRRTRALARLPETIEGRMFLVGCVYNFCTYHHSLREPIYLPGNRHRWVQRTPAMAAGLTDHCWTGSRIVKLSCPATAHSGLGGRIMTAPV